jgi:predicted DNA-binding protein (MmcQ/YjbR family)
VTPKQVEAAALALPGATVDFPWGGDHPVYKVGGKMFAAMGGGKAPSSRSNAPTSRSKCSRSARA